MRITNTKQEHNCSSPDSELSSSLVVISILNWNGWQNTLGCLESVRNLCHRNYLIVVVENGSMNDSIEKLRAWGNGQFGKAAFVEYSREQALHGGEAASEARINLFASSQRMVLINNKENLGFTGGNNVVLKYALARRESADYVFLLNNDATVEESCIHHLISVGRKTGAGIVGAAIKDGETGNLFFAGWVGSYPLLRQFFSPLFRFRPGIPDPAEGFQTSYWVSGAGMLISRNVLQAMHKSYGHYLDDSLFLYWDELQLCGQARRLGYASVVANRAVVYHRQASASGGPANPLLCYYTTRNRILVAASLLPWPLQIIFPLFNIPIVLRDALINAVKGRSRSAGAILSGLADGYTRVRGKWKFHDQEVRRLSAG